ncbi:CoA-binding protein, partial [bacterium]|nr:CoA-binding protein [bacterium]
EYGLTTAELSQQSKEELQKLFPAWMPVANPVDIWPAIERHIGTDVDVYGSALRSILADPGVDAALLLVLAGSTRIVANMQDLAELTKRTGKPVFVWVIGRREAAYAMFEEARKHGVLAYQELSRAVECMAAVFRERHAGSGDRPAAASSPLEKIGGAQPGPMDEHEARAVLRDCGIPVVKEIVAGTRDACLEAAGKLGWPVVLKGMARGVTHKTERGLVRLNVASTDAAAQVFDELMQAMEGKGTVSVQQQVRGAVEIIVGMFCDAQFGACVMVGLGGVMAEAFQDAAFAMAPLTHQEALRLINRIRGRRLLDGFRGMPKVNRDELAGILVAVGNLGAANDRISEIDINPLMATAKGLVAVDAVVVIR